MPVVCIETVDYPRIDIFRDLRLFLAEETTVSRRLFQSEFDVHSVLISDRKWTTIGTDIADDITVYRLPHRVARQLVGYSFHSGVLVAGIRKPSPDAVAVASAAGERMLFVVCPHLIDPENVGAMIRVSAAFGATAVVLGPSGADPFSRRVLRSVDGQRVVSARPAAG